MEIIVFSQQELLCAISAGHESVLLCDNSYQIPPVGNVLYTAIGNVKTEIPLSRAECEKLNIRFLNFTPVYLKAAPVFVPLRYSGKRNSSFGGSGSYLSSLSSSYRFNTSYRLSTSYQFNTSYRLSTSYRFNTSYQFNTSYRFLSSYRFGSSFSTSYLFTSSYFYAGSFSFATSYRYITSYRYALTSSFASSFRTSFSLSSSYKGQQISSIASRLCRAAEENNHEVYISVNGYGIDLI